MGPKGDVDTPACVAVALDVNCGRARGSLPQRIGPLARTGGMGACIAEVVEIGAAPFVLNC
jgi:hypothetical protein